MSVMKNPKKLVFLFFFPFLLSFFSCTASIDGAVREGGAVELQLRASLGPRITGVVRSLRLFMGEGEETPLLDGPAISRSLALTPGIRSASLRNLDDQTLDGLISVSNLEEFLVPVHGLHGRFITYTEGQSSSIVVYLDREIAPLLVSLLFPELEEYLSALMAPALLGEAMTAGEYLNLIASFYARPVADEIAAGRIRASIEFPRPLSFVQGGTFSGRRAEFDISLLDLLVLEQPLRYEVRW